MQAKPSSTPGVERAARTAAGDGEAELVRAARGGDRDAFGKLVLIHQDAVMAAARYLARDPEDAADVSQEAFLRAFRGLPGFDGQCAFRTWLLTIAANAARSLMTRKRARKRSANEVRISGEPGGEPLDLAEPDGRSSPEGRAMRREVKEALEEAISLLDEESRAAVVLRDLAGEPYEAIARALGLPLGTVKSRIHRARLELRERLRGIL